MTEQKFVSQLESRIIAFLKKRGTSYSVTELRNIAIRAYTDVPTMVMAKNVSRAIYNLIDYSPNIRTARGEKTTLTYKMASEVYSPEENNIVTGSKEHQCEGSWIIVRVISEGWFILVQCSKCGIFGNREVKTGKVYSGSGFYQPWTNKYNTKKRTWGRKSYINKS